MVNIKEIRSSNARLKDEPAGLVAVFAGATSGCGKGALEAFARYANAPTAYIIGRSKSASTPLLEKLASLNPQGTFNFIETEISLIRNVDKVCDEIKSKEKKIDFMSLSPGYLTFAGRQETVEGIDTLLSLDFYARLRIVHNLLPLLTASPVARVVSILAGGMEEAIDLNDLEGLNKSGIIAISGLAATQTTLALEELANKYPSISFVHFYPGLVNTGQLYRTMQTASGLWAWPAWLASWTVLPLIYGFSRTIEEVGERVLYLATSARYPPADSRGKGVGVALSPGIKLAKSSVETDGKGNGVYRLNADGESAPESSVLVKYREEGAPKRVWEHAQALWKRAVAKQV